MREFARILITTGSVASAVAVRYPYLWADRAGLGDISDPTTVLPR